MMHAFHFLRPWWLLGLIVIAAIGYLLARRESLLRGWSEICDELLLKHLQQRKGQSKRMTSLTLVLASFGFMILSLSGPTWHQYPVPSYKPVLPQVVLLDMSQKMQEQDLTPDRLTRAKFKLHDILMRKDVGQFGLIVFSGEPFVVSPLTDDGETIDALLSALTPDVMPVQGYNLATALKEAQKLIVQAGYQEGEILVMSADVPDRKAMDEARTLASMGVYSSIMPVRADADLNPLFQQFAQAGEGALLKYTPDSTDLNRWLERNSHKTRHLGHQDDIPLWRDEGRWFLLPALFCLLPVFRRGWVQRLEL